MSAYLLPCECGRSVAVDVSQAGREVACGCGKKLVVPKLSQLRQLPTAESDSSAARKGRVESRTWGRAQGILFGIGVVVTTIGLLVAGNCYLNWAPIKGFSSEQLQVDKVMSDEVDAMSALDTWQLWSDMRKETPAEQHVPDFVHIDRFQKTMVFYMRVSLSAAGLGLALAIASIVFRK